MTKLTWRWAIGAAAVAMLASGCVAKQTGKEGNFAFSYWTDDGVRDFNKPLAIGSMLEVSVVTAGQEAEAVTLDGAESGDPDVLEVESFAGNKFIIEGISEGLAEISVTGEGSSDRIDFSVVEPEVLELWHSCLSQGERQASYLVGDRIWMPFEMKLSNGRAVIGYGRYPVNVEPAAGAMVVADSRNQTWIPLDLGNDKGVVTLTSQIDGTTATLNLVEEADIDGVGLTDDQHQAYVGRDRVLPAVPTVGGEAVCQANLQAVVDTSTPEVCEVRTPNIDESGDLSDEDKRDLGWLEGNVIVRGKTTGTCTFSLSLPTAAGGQGVSEEFSVEVVEPPANPDEGDEDEGGAVSS